MSVQLGISKLADPSRSGKNENLTLETLLKAVENELQGENYLRGNLQGLLDRYHELSSRIKHRRNKQIAHRDLSSSLSPIDGPSREEIENALAALRDFMNAIESHFNHSTTAYRQFLSRHDGDALICVLKQGLRYAELQNQGVIPWDDFQKSSFLNV